MPTSLLKSKKNDAMAQGQNRWPSTGTGPFPPLVPQHEIGRAYPVWEEIGFVEMVRAGLQATLAKWLKR